MVTRKSNASIRRVSAGTNLALLKIEGVGDFVKRSMHIYGSEVNEDRAVPSLQDGFKPVQRRLVWASDKVAKTKVKSAMPVSECFAAGTMVLLEGGASLPIEELRLCDVVKTDAGNFPITELFEIPNRQLYEVVTSKGVVQATPDQIFFCLDGNGKEVERTPLTLKAGDRIKCRK